MDRGEEARKGSYRGFTFRQDGDNALRRKKEK